MVLIHIVPEMVKAVAVISFVASAVSLHWVDHEIVRQRPWLRFGPYILGALAIACTVAVIGSGGWVLAAWLPLAAIYHFTKVRSRSR